MTDKLPLEWIDDKDYSVLHFADFALYVTVVPDSPSNYEVELVAFDVTLFTHDLTEETLDIAKDKALSITQLWCNAISQSLTSFREHK